MSHDGSHGTPVSIESLQKVMNMELPPSTADVISLDDSMMNTLWLKAQGVLEARHSEMFQKCTFDDTGAANRMLLYDGAPSALWFVKGGRCFLAVVPTERGIVEVNSHVDNHVGVFVVHRSSVEGVILVEIKVANAGALASLVYASQLTFPHTQHTARMKLLSVMKEAPTDSAGAGDLGAAAATPHTPPLDVSGWASVWSDVGSALKFRHFEMFQKCIFDDSGAANRMLMYDGVPTALWFMKGGMSFLATTPTACGAAEIEGLIKGKCVVYAVSLEGCLLFKLSTIDTTECRELVVDILLRSQKSFQIAAQAIRQRMAKKVDEAKGVMKLLPHMVFMGSAVFKEVFRPVPTHIIPMQLSFLRKGTVDPMEAPVWTAGINVLLFRGASGAGKSAAASSLPSKYITRDDDAAIIGYYVVADADTTLTTLATAVSEHMATSIKESLGKSIPAELGKVVCYVVVDEVGDRYELVQDVVAKGASTIKTAVFKELKGLDQLVKISKNAFCEGLSVVIGLAGTGVGRPKEAGGSLPEGYYNCDVAGDLAEEVFKGALHLKDANVGAVMAAVKTDPLLDSMLTNARCAQFAGEELGRLIHVELVLGEDFFSNPRLVELVRQNAEPIVSRVSSNYINVNGWGKHNKDQKLALVSALLTIPLTQPHGYHVVSDMTLDALTCKVGAVVDTLHWATVASTGLPQVPECAISKIAREQFKAHPIIPTTKDVVVNQKKVTMYPHIDKSLRFVIPPAVLVVMLSWLAKSPIFGTGKASPSSIYETILPYLTQSTLEAFLRHGREVQKPIPLLLLYPELQSHCADTTVLLDTAALATKIQLAPPADGAPLPKGEAATKTIRRSYADLARPTPPVNEAKATPHGATALKDIQFLAPTDCAPSARYTKKTFGRSLADAGTTAKNGSEGAQSTRPVNEATVPKDIPLILPTNGHPSTRYEASKTALDSSCGIMVEIAGEGVPQNDTTVYSRSAVVGEEYKHYTRGGYVDVEVLQKRAYQMGYQRVTITVKVDKGSLAKKYGKPVLRLMDDGFLNSLELKDILSADPEGDEHVTLVIKTKSSITSGLGKYHALRMRALLAGPPENVCPPEYVVLCSPEQALLPANVAVKFTGRAAVVTGETESITYAYPRAEKDVPCKVVCKTFSIAEYATRCSGLLKHDDASPHTEQPRYYVSDRDNSPTADASGDHALIVKKSNDKSFYFCNHTVYSGRPDKAVGDFLAKDASGCSASFTYLADPSSDSTKSKKSKKH
jgi:hypothetical protein